MKTKLHSFKQSPKSRPAVRMQWVKCIFSSDYSGSLCIDARKSWLGAANPERHDPYLFKVGAIFVHHRAWKRCKNSKFISRVRQVINSLKIVSKLGLPPVQSKFTPWELNRGPWVLQHSMCICYAQYSLLTNCERRTRLKRQDSCAVKAHRLPTSQICNIYLHWRKKMETNTNASYSIWAFGR